MQQKGLAIFLEMPPPYLCELHMTCGVAFSERSGFEKLRSGWGIIFRLDSVTEKHPLHSRIVFFL